MCGVPRRPCRSRPADGRRGCLGVGSLAPPRTASSPSRRRGIRCGSAAHGKEQSQAPTSRTVPPGATDAAIRWRELGRTGPRAHGARVGERLEGFRDGRGVGHGPILSDRALLFPASHRDDGNRAETARAESQSRGVRRNGEAMADGPIRLDNHPGRSGLGTTCPPGHPRPGQLTASHLRLRRLGRGRDRNRTPGRPPQVAQHPPRPAGHALGRVRPRGRGFQPLCRDQGHRSGPGGRGRGPAPADNGRAVPTPGGDWPDGYVTRISPQHVSGSGPWRLAD